MGTFTKQEARVLRGLASRAQRAELSGELTKLESHFGRWRKGEIEPADLANLIHEFHDGPNRDLYKLYNSPDLALLVARAIAFGFLEASAVPAELRSKLQPLVDYATENLR
jgi:hypothetical protein